MRPEIMVSHAQNFEDVMLARALRDVDGGFYVDVGAWDPNIETVTRYFYEIGWHGINVEPVPAYHEMLQTARPRDINLRVAAGKEDGHALITAFQGTGMSTLDASVASKQERHGFAHRQIEIEVRTLNAIFNEHAAREVHFLKVDCEGTEADVINAFDLSRYRPWVILAESVDPSSRVETHGDWEPHLLRSGYRFVYFDGLNRFYLASEHEELAEHFRSPPNVFDDFTVARFGGYPVYAPQFAPQMQKSLGQRLWESARNVGRSLKPSSG
jgi:FkbM family methyltransferase